MVRQPAVASNQNKSSSVVGGKSIMGNNNNKKKKKGERASDMDEKEVSWGGLVIREFPYILGDNPGVAGGAPLALAWKPTNEQEMPIALFEYKRSMRHRRDKPQLRLSSKERKAYLLGEGYTEAEVDQAAREADDIRSSRDSNLAKSRLDTFKTLFLRQTNKFNTQRLSELRKVAANSA